MSKISKAVKSQYEDKILRKNETVKNFMGGDSYIYNPLDTLKMITASSIFGEPSYYRDGGIDSKHVKKSGLYTLNKLLTGYSIIPEFYDGKTTTEIMIDAIDKALDYDYVGTLKWAVELRTVYNIRLNPQIIIVRAAIHPKRKEYTENGLDFGYYMQKVMMRPDEPMSQMAYYMFINNGEKNRMPSILKRNWAKKLSSLKRYAVNKYKNSEIGMINAVRICHANSNVINELMKTGTVVVDDSEKTWEQYRSEGKDWMYILENCNMGHMAMLRNIRGIFSEVSDMNVFNKFSEKLIDGVPTGKQFPFRYWSAYKAVANTTNINFRNEILNVLEQCMDKSIENIPKMNGKTIVLSDNSGSAWGCIPTEYGSVTVAEIDNLSAIITAKCSDEGYVGVFGDRLEIVPISKHTRVLEAMKKVNAIGKKIGMGTENGIWVFFKNALKNKDFYDNIFIYSDQQAGHGGLYGTTDSVREYTDLGYKCNYNHVNVFKLLLDYRKSVNSKVNMFSVQTAGYNNVVIPEMTYRCSLMYGWTGKEVLFADMLIKQWDEIENRN